MNTPQRRRRTAFSFAFPPRNAGGFTLVELLIVIAIIGILAAILFPIFARARNRNNQAACLSNERQLSSAWLMYSQDYDGKVVPWSMTGRSNSDAFVWDRLLHPYVKNDAIFQCPANASPVGYSYSANVGGASPSPAIRSLASLHNPGQSPIIADCAGFPEGGWSYSFIIPDETGGNQARAVQYGSFKDGKPTGELMWSRETGRTEAATIKADAHDGGANYIFADGHTKWLVGEKSGTRVLPARKGLDYDSDGILGDDPAAETGGMYD